MGFLSGRRGERPAKSKLFESADGFAAAIVWVAYRRFSGIKRGITGYCSSQVYRRSRPTALEDPVPSLELDRGRGRCPVTFIIAFNTAREGSPSDAA